MKFTLCDSHPGFKTYLIHLTFSRQSYHYTLSCLSILGATFPLSQNLQHELFRLARRLFGVSLLPSCGYLTVRSLLHVELSEPTRDALTRSGVELVRQVGLIMQIPASSSLARVKAAILMIKE